MIYEACPICLANMDDKTKLKFQIIKTNNRICVEGRDIASKIAKGPNLIYSSIKDALRQTENLDEQPAFDVLRSLETVKKVYNSKDLKEGATSFTHKKKPRWQGK